MPDSTSSTSAEQGSMPQDYASTRSWRERAESVLPTGASTGSKRAAALYGDASSDAPTHFVRANGCRVTDVTGATFVDCTMALGSVALGYADPRVTTAVMDAAREGNVSALSSWREVALAERLCAMIPCAERVQFLKSGAEATAAAVRIARTYTGRDRVIACGYFGWHDWSSDAAGVPPSTRNDIVRVPFDDVVALERAASDVGGALAAIVLEPIIERAPSMEWITRARELCDQRGAALIFDEVKTGFRVAPGGYQEVCDVTPDLASFGKAMANGFPLAAVVGSSPLMDAARKTWISSTLASESTALAASLAVLERHDEMDVCAALSATGRAMRVTVENAIASSKVRGVHIEGIDAMWFLRWDDPAREVRFVRDALRAGALLKRGAYNFAALAHDDEALAAIERAAHAGFETTMHEDDA